MLYFLFPVLAYFVYLFLARLRLKQLAYTKQEPATRIERLRWWAENPLSPVKLEARLLWAEAIRPANAAYAWEVLNDALELSGRKAVPARLLAGRWAMLEKWPEHAERHFEHALALLTRKKDALLRARIHRLRAECALRANQGEAALVCCDQSLQDNPYDSEVRLLRAGIRFHEGNPAASLEDYDFLESHFGNPALRTRAALGASVSEVAMLKLPAAAKRLEKLLAEKVGNQEQVRARLVCVQGLAGGMGEAGQDTAAAAEAYAAMGRQDWETAQRKLAEALFQTKPTEPLAGELLWLLAGALRAAGRSQQALETEARIRAVWPHSPYLQTPWPAQTASATERVAI